MKRSRDKEMMDLPGQPRELLEESLDDIRAINHYLGNYRSVMRGLARLVREQKLVGFSLLDVGTGSGDIPALITNWAQLRGIKTSIIALEPEPVTARLAATLTQRTNPPFIPLLQRGKEGDFRRFGISVVRGDGYAPPFRPASFDFVLASQLLHHFPEDKIVTLLRTWSKVARKAIIISDLVRHPVAYHGIRLITKLFTRNVMTRTDAPLSVQRAFTITEWRELFRRADVGPVELFPVFPFRVLALLSLPG
jgi:SAM-dependent methyltransferase